MIHTRKVVALLPIKDNSERVPGKNFRDFAGKPLYHHIVGTLDRTYAVDEIVIDTDSHRVLVEAPKLSPKVRVIERPPELRGDMVSTNRIFEFDLSRVAGDLFVQTHATNPLLRSETVSRALHAFLENEGAGSGEIVKGVKDDQRSTNFTCNDFNVQNAECLKSKAYGLMSSPGCDSLFSVNAYRSRFYRADGAPINHDPENLIRTQDLPPLYEENSCLYVFTRESFGKRNRRIGEKPMMFPTSPMESIDIDDEFAFRLAELLALYSRKR